MDSTDHDALLAVLSVSGAGYLSQPPLARMKPLPVVSSVAYQEQSKLEER
ncbi:hypothetical protein [Paraburkholderia sp. D1E]